MPLLRSSKWTYHVDTDSAVSADVVIASGGMITLSDPGGKRQTLYFGRSGIDAPAHGRHTRIDLPLMVRPEQAQPLTADPLLPDAKRAEEETTQPRVPEKPREKDAQALAAKSDDKQDAIVEKGMAQTLFMTNAVFDEELSLAQLRGGAIFVDARLRLFPEADVCALLLGINASEMMFGLSSPVTFHMAERAIAQARAVLLMPDVTVGLHSDPHIGVLPGYLN